MREGKADLFRRFLAALVDGLITAGLRAVLPIVVGPLAGGLYYLFRDGLMYELTKKEEWRGRSIGKKLFHLQVVRLDKGPVDLVVSAKRNITLSLGILLAAIPLLGWIVGMVITVAFTLIEVALIFTDSQGRRLGDRWAATRVVETAADATSGVQG